MESCDPGSGCFEAACIPACEAAQKSQGSLGCTFFAATPPFRYNGDGTSYDGPCHALLISNAWDRPAKLEVRRDDVDLDPTTFVFTVSGLGDSAHYVPIGEDGIPAGQVGVAFLSHRPGSGQPGLEGSFECPEAPALLEDTAVTREGSGSAFQIGIDTPVTIYDILPYGGATSFLPSASLLLPVTAWGTQFVGAAPLASEDGELWALAIGQEDNTEVLFGFSSGTIATTLKRGETFQLYNRDLAGVSVEASAPVALLTGSTYLKVSSKTSPQGGAGDAAHQQLLPVRALGSAYVSGGIVSRLASGAPESVPYRMVGVSANTELTWDPGAPLHAPTSLKAGEVADFEATFPFAVHSQDADHPFMLTQYMPGYASPSVGGCSPGISCLLGDDDWIALLPEAQYLQRYVFFVDPTYGTSNLVVVRKSTDGEFADVTVDCLGPITEWQELGLSGEYTFAHVDLVRSLAAQGNCTAGLHEASSASPFGLVVWGTDHTASYGYAAGGNVATINDVEVVVPK